MRKQLKKIENVRSTFTGTFERYGLKSGFMSPTVTLLLKDVRDDAGKIVTDHLWFNKTKGMENLGELVEGQVIKFDARVKPYVKGYVNNKYGIDNRTLDYKLSHPTKLSIIQEVQPLILLELDYDRIVEMVKTMDFDTISFRKRGMFVKVKGYKEDNHTLMPTKFRVSNHNDIPDSQIGVDVYQCTVPKFVDGGYPLVRKAPNRVVKK